MVGPDKYMFFLFVTPSFWQLFCDILEPAAICDPANRHWAIGVREVKKSALFCPFEVFHRHSESTEYTVLHQASV